MAVHEVTFYQAKCDCCATVLDDYGEHAAWSDPDIAIERAEDWNWTHLDGSDYCENCHYYDENTDDTTPIPGCDHKETTNE